MRDKRLRTAIAGDEVDRPIDLVDRRFVAVAPNVLWVADLTYVMTFSETVYVAFIIDVFSRRIEGCLRVNVLQLTRPGEVARRRSRRCCRYERRRV